METAAFPARSVPFQVFTLTVVDVIAPTVISVVVSNSAITDATPGVGNPFTVTITFSEPMNTVANAPTITFSPSVASTLTFTSGIWSAGGTVFTATYSVADAGVSIPAVDVTIAGAKDLAGNVQVPRTVSALFAILTQDQAPPTPPSAPKPPLQTLPIAFTPLNGNAPITIVDPVSGQQFFIPNPLAGFNGPVSVAVGDVNGDGTADLIVAAGSGGSPRVVVLDGATGVKTVDFFAFDMGFTGGVSLAVGDVNGDGRADIVVGAGAGGGPNVRVFDGNNLALLVDVLVFEQGFAGGVNVAVGDLNGDGRGEVIVAAGAGGGPHVKAFDALSLAYVSSFFAFSPNFSGGVSVAAGDTNGDGIDDIIVGAGPGGGPHVRAYSGYDLALVADFFAYDSGFSGGVNVGRGGVRNFNRLAILTGPGPTGPALVRGFDPLSGTLVFEQQLTELPSIGADVS